MKRTLSQGHGRFPRTLEAALVFALSLWITGCMLRAGTPDPPNLVLITLDTTRPDHCSVYGYERDTTPNLVMLAEQGARFDLAYAPMSVTGPAVATIFTSLYPVAHGAVENALTLLPEHKTLAEILVEHEYQTAAVVSSLALNERFGYGQGFDLYHDQLDSGKHTFTEDFWPDHPEQEGVGRRAHDATQRAVAWLSEDRAPGRPFFLFVHYFDPHAPYVPPVPFAEKYTDPADRSDKLKHLIDLYDAEIAFTDWQVGVLLEALDWMELGENTLVVLTGDHGEGLMQHGYMLHGPDIYEESVRVPLIIRWPGRIRSGQTLSAPVELVDLVPTILDLIGVEAPALPFQGRSLAAALRGQAALDPERPVFLQRRPYEPRTVEALPGYGPEAEDSIRVAGQKHGIRIGKWKYIEGTEDGTKELFDLESDPGEQTNLYRQRPEKAAALAERIEKWKRSHTPDGLAQVPVSDEDRARLQVLGYID